MDNVPFIIFFIKILFLITRIKRNYFTRKLYYIILRSHLAEQNIFVSDVNRQQVRLNIDTRVAPLLRRAAEAEAPAAVIVYVIIPLIIRTKREISLPEPTKQYTYIIIIMIINNNILCM